MYDLLDELEYLAGEYALAFVLGVVIPLCATIGYLLSK
jgi:hypothetical protein